MTDTTFTSSSTTAAARDAHATSHFLDQGTTPEIRANMARDCGFCARIWDPTDGSFRAEARARITPRVERDYSRPGRPIITGDSAPRSTATQAQFDFIKGLLAKRDVSSISHKVGAARVMATEGLLTKAQASELITELKTMPFACSEPTPAAEAQPTARKPWPKVEQGYYALTLTDLEGTGFKNGVNFFHVKRPTSGQFAGRTFLSILASDAHHKVYGDLARAVLEGIAADPHAAAMLFAKESNHCYRCNRRLTDDESRTAGMGPTCRSL